jgi:hypothetical protein
MSSDLAVRFRRSMKCGTETAPGILHLNIEKDVVLESPYLSAPEE